MKHFLLVSGTIFLVFGVLVGSTAFRSREESSISEAASIAVLTSGTIAIGISHDQRVQLYSREGDYLGAVSVDSDWGGIRLQALRNGGFQAATIRNRKLYTFDSAGGLVSIEDSVDDYESFGASGQWEATSTGGEVYTLDGPLLTRRVGTSLEVVVDHSDRWPLGSDPLVAMLLLVSGLGQLLIGFFGADRFRSLVGRAARMKQPQWVRPNEHSPGS